MEQGFGEAMGKTGGLRNAIGQKPIPPIFSVCRSLPNAAASWWRRGIKPASAHFYSEEALRWPLVDSRTLKAAGPAFIGMPEPDRSSEQQNGRALRAFVEKNAQALGLRQRIPVELHPLEVTRLAAADRDLRVVMSTTAVQRKKSAKESEAAPSRVRLIFDRTGKLRYAIAAGGSV
jgi:hypothetical protein